MKNDKELVRYSFIRGYVKTNSGFRKRRIIKEHELGEYVLHSQAAEIIAAVRRQAFEEAARLVETSAYRSTTDGRSLVPCQFAKHDHHHATIAASIRALSAEPVQEEPS